MSFPLTIVCPIEATGWLLAQPAGRLFPRIFLHISLVFLHLASRFMSLDLIPVSSAHIFIAIETAGEIPLLPADRLFSTSYFSNFTSLASQSICES